MTNVWHVARDKDGYFVVLSTGSNLFPPLEALVSILEAIDGASGHLLCGQSWPEWAWKVPILPLWEEDGWPKFSVPSTLYSWFSKLVFLPEDQLTQQKTIRISPEEAKQLNPHFADWDAFWEEEE